MRRILSLGTLVWIFVAGGAVCAVDVDRYAWEFPRVREIREDSVTIQNLKTELRAQIQDVLSAGDLTPLRVNHADEHSDAYFVYLEPGRIITTLAWAYPHLPSALQAAVKRYVDTQFQSDRLAPWNPGRLPADMPGTRRELYPIHRIGNWSSDWQAARPTIQSLYGVWLWAYRADDLDRVRPHWSNIKDAYRVKLSQADIYGTMSAHVAVLRLAATFQDEDMRQFAWNNLSTNLHVGLGFRGDPEIHTDESRMSQIEKNTMRMYLKNNNGGLYWPKQNGSIYRGMMFYGLSPEIGRYLAENVRDETLKRHAYGMSRFPLWWLMDAPYFQRDYTGDEGIGLVQSEMMGMLYPVERWIVMADASTLSGYLASAPSCRGDCVWIEALVQTIEAHGRTEWLDVRKHSAASP